VPAATSWAFALGSVTTKGAALSALGVGRMKRSERVLTHARASSASAFGPSETHRDVRFCAANLGIADIKRSAVIAVHPALPSSTFDHLTITANDRGELYAMSWFYGVMRVAAQASAQSASFKFSTRRNPRHGRSAQRQ
jgi:hypothetical protein